MGNFNLEGPETLLSKRKNLMSIIGPSCQCQYDVEEQNKSLKEIRNLVYQRFDPNTVPFRNLTKDVLNVKRWTFF